MKFKSGFLFFYFPIMIFVGACIAHADPNETSLIEIFKHDGSVQCENNSGILLVLMEKELKGKGIKIYTSRTSHDGLSYMAVCGAPTGKINIYKIKASDLSTAQSLGFSIYTNKR